MCKNKKLLLLSLGKIRYFLIISIFIIIKEKYSSDFIFIFTWKYLKILNEVLI